MVSEGMAWVYDSYVTDKTFYQNQQEAQKQQQGQKAQGQGAKQEKKDTGKKEEKVVDAEFEEVKKKDNKKSA